MQAKAVQIEEIYQEILDGKRSRFPPNTWKEDSDRELSKRVTKYLIETILKWNEEDIKQKWNTPLIIKYRLLGALKHGYDNSPYKMIEDLYPNRFKEWEFGMAPLNFWTKEKALEALKWTVEEKEKLSKVELLKFYSKKWLEKNKLSAPLVMYWNGSPYAMINSLYPNKFKEWEFSMTPNNFWTKEKALEALKWTVEEKEKLSKVELLKFYSKKWLEKNKLSAPLVMYWNGSPYAMINSLYPNKFKEWEFSMTPNNFWTKEKALVALRWTIEEKEKLTSFQLLQVYSVKWLTIHNLISPCQIFWNNSPYSMINELYPGQNKEWEYKFTPTGFWTEKKH
ncbi:DUF4046 domain-containing protein [Bacillus anthracis]|uniref:DUF4046 domain-containing protein n=10 Tax=Bacillus TaxID=1386 RepID=UPI0002F815A9|nr:DUF4046 domain-containing protein [Bacillus anthracis]AIK60050.1 hypothetical protein DJ44_1313 [Bacillus anthracis]AIM12371.1 hypothetical protein BAHan_3347 [Bacillus anthracis]ANR05514.1 hypothetical protein AOQ81_15405 [Bacillus anthracis]ANR10811.1 hypothetical protein AOQ80_15410 [Bacillus anthracis]ANR16109.1 hypothetical protein AOD59_15415 [Bacillus anthracis]